MKPFAALTLGLLTLASSRCKDPISPPPPPVAPPAVLVFHKTAGFAHTSIPVGIQTIRELGQEHGFQVESTADAGWFTSDKLRGYQVVVFLNTTQDVLDPAQQTAFEQYIRAGHGFVGVHAATDTEYDWPWYKGLVGGYFNGHPNIQPATIRITDRRHPATATAPDPWPRTDEWYNFRDLAPDLRVLARLDETTYTGGTHGANHPIAWYHSYDGGRAFYTALGHTEASYAEPAFRQHLWGGIQYALGQ
jgi:type 1 glutamine amidotransferase